MYIDPKVSNSVTAAEKAIIAKYNFRVIAKNGNVEIRDTANGTTIGKTVAEALKAAVAKITPVETPKVETPKNGNGNGGVKTAAAAPTKAGKGKVLPAATAVPATVTATEAAPAAEVEDVDLDDTGKRARKGRKVREKRVRKDNRYLRAAKVLVTNLDMEAAALSKAAEMSHPTATHCLDAWKGVTAALLAAGAFNDTWVKKLTPVKPAPKKVAAQAARVTVATKRGKVVKAGK